MGRDAGQWAEQSAGWLHAALCGRTATAETRANLVIAALDSMAPGELAEGLRAARADLAPGAIADLSAALILSRSGAIGGAAAAVILDAGSPSRLRNSLEFLWEEQLSQYATPTSSALAFEAACEAEGQPINPALIESAMTVALRQISRHQVEQWWTLSDRARQRLREEGRDESWMISVAAGGRPARFPADLAQGVGDTQDLAALWRRSIGHPGSRAFRNVLADVLPPDRYLRVVLRAADLLSPESLALHIESVEGARFPVLAGFAAESQAEGWGGELSVRLGHAQRPYACQTACLAALLAPNAPRAVDLLLRALPGPPLPGERTIPADLLLEVAARVHPGARGGTEEVARRVAAEIGAMLPLVYRRITPEARALLRAAGLQREILGQRRDGAGRAPSFVAELVADFAAPDCDAALAGDLDPAAGRALAARREALGLAAPVAAPGLRLGL